MKTLIKFNNIPLANNLSDTSTEVQLAYDLHIVFDEDTKLVSLADNVSPKLLFGDTYVYDSSQSSTMVEHFKSAASTLYNRFNPKKVLEIGSNSGIFIKNFTDAVAVEPCKNFADLTNDMGIKTYAEYWNEEVTEKVLNEYGKLDLIYSANTISHIQNLEECLKLVNMCLADNGVFVVEAPSFLEVLKYNTFDQFYHEHQSYFSCISLNNVLANVGMEIFDIESYPVHGGSYRYYIQTIGGNNNKTENVKDILNEELEYGIDNYDVIIQKIDIMKQNMLDIKSKLTELAEKNYQVIGYAATAKFIQIISMCNLDHNLIKYIVDTTPYKHGKYVPNTKIEIRPYDVNCLDGIKYCFLGAWNYKNEIFKKENKFLNGGGKFITHVPRVEVISTPMPHHNEDKWKYYKYDIEKYNFRELLCEMFGRDDLENLHDSVSYSELFSQKTEQSTIYHKEFYRQIRGSKFLKTYNQFIADCIKPHFDDRIVYQKIPTFRTQFLNNISVGKYHKDKDYNHNEKEVNCYMSLTDSINTNAVWAESEEDRGDYKPLNAKYGEFILWDGANCRHGNKENVEGFTRISFDFRVMKYSDYDKNERQGKLTGHAKVPMLIGDYYEVM
tara:strand:- start:386 stop:2221 length:1836 start_codon:yes stop_codon:yes gene_type:complete